MPQARNMSCRSQPAPASGQSAFLQFLQELDADTFCQTLLPKIIKDDSAGNLAATCSQLRKLCHISVAELNFCPVLDDVQPHAAEEWVQHLQDHFPNCSSVMLQVEGSNSYQAVNYMLPALARLPDLKGLSIDVDGPPLAEMLPMALLLRSLRTQLSGLQSLTLELSQSWTGAGLAWAELAAMTQLTQLSITSTCEDDSPWIKADLLKLSELCDLKDLAVTFERVDQAEHPVCLHLVSQMSALTTLKLSISSADGIEGLRNCINLHNLEMFSKDAGLSFEMPASGWRLIGQLTQLTNLTLWPVTQRTDSEACRSALQQLTGLKSVAAEVWPPEIMVGLQGLSHLTTVGGGWSASDGSAVDVTLPQIQQLWATQDHIPCSAFPNLLHVSLFAAIPSAVLTALSTNCCCLQSITLLCLPNTPCDASSTLPAAEPVADRVAAVMSLSSLQHLTSLDFCVHDNAEMLALAHAAAVLTKRTFKQARLLVPEESEVSSSGLLALGKLSGMDALYVWMLKPSLMRSSVMAQVFVATLAGVKRLQLFVDAEDQHTSLTSAFEHAESCGLPLAPEHSVTVVE